MNNYIFDWIGNCKKIMDGEGYSTGNRQYREQIVLIKYLIEEHYSKEEIYELWVSSSPILIQKLGDDKEEILFIFEELWNRAIVWNIPTQQPPFVVYKSELDFINKMEVGMWIKQYIMTLLCVYKYYNKKWCKYTPEIKTFCFSVTDYLRERDRHRARLSDAIQKYQLYEISMLGLTLSFKVNFVATEGEVVAVLDNPREVEKLFPFLICEKICSCCGEKYNYTSKTYKSILCPSCKKKERHKKQNSYKKKKRSLQHIGVN